MALSKSPSSLERVSKVEKEKKKTLNSSQQHPPVVVQVPLVSLSFLCATAGILRTLHDYAQPPQPNRSQTDTQWYICWLHCRRKDQQKQLPASLYASPSSTSPAG